MTRPLLLVSAALALTLGGTLAQAKVALMSPAALTRSSPIIAVVRVRRVETIEGVKVARATVVTPLKGTTADATLLVVAEPTWECDTSHAVAGETVLIFLVPLPATPGLQSSDRLRKAAQRLGAGTGLFLISNSGRGRVPVRELDGRLWVERGYGWEDASTSTRKMAGGDWMPLDDAKRYVRRLAGTDKHP
jgi:hypothetical protein